MKTKILIYIISALIIGGLILTGVNFYKNVLEPDSKAGAGNGEPYYCEYICPSGTLFGGIPLVTVNSGLRDAIGFRFWWKIGLLLIILLSAVKSYRPFCKYLCPLGACYSLFNPVAIYRYKLNKEKCTGCGACAVICKMGIDPVKNPNSLECIRCGECLTGCPSHAIEKYNPIKGLAKESDHE